MAADDPIREVEQRAGQHDLGRMAVNVYRGALAEADGNRRLAFVATAAYFAGMMRAGSDEGDE